MKNGNRYVSWFSVFGTIVLIVTIIWMLILGWRQINQVDVCCNVSLEKPNNETYPIDNILKPEGVESYIDDPEFPKDTTHLFPIEIVAISLKCEDMNITLIGMPNLGNMTCFG